MMYMNDLSKFKPIPGYSKYMINEYGVVFSTVRSIQIAVAHNWAGYQTVTITDDNGFRAPRKVHRLVYLTYIGNLLDGKVIDHIDNDKNNNHYTNLRQITPSENSLKSFTSGKNKSKVVWTKSIVKKICKLLSKNKSNDYICAKLNIPDDQKEKCCRLIEAILRGSVHQTIAKKFNLSKYIKSINKKDRKLKVIEVEDIYVSWRSGNISKNELAKKYNVSWSTIDKICKKKTWKIVTDKIDEEWIFL